MKYVVYDVDEQVPVITDKPADYVSSFEPIDVVDGKIIAWDEDGNLYHFGPKQQFEQKKIVGPVSWENVGEWDYTKGEPVLEKVKDGDREGLKETLLKYLNHHKPSNELDGMSIGDLMSTVQSITEE